MNNLRGNPLARRERLFSAHHVDLLIDVGANAGQYALQMRDVVGYKGWIVSFEPLSSAFHQLSRRAVQDGKWKAVNAALGPSPGSAVLNVSANSLSSSLLPILDLHLRSAPEAVPIGTEIVLVQTLAAALDSHEHLGERPFVKIDAQGYERSILDSGGPGLERVVGVQLEMSLVPLYQGEALLIDMIAYLDGLGFTLMSLEPGYADRNTGRMLQADGVFFRE